MEIPRQSLPNRVKAMALAPVVAGAAFFGVGCGAEHAPSSSPETTHITPEDTLPKVLQDAPRTPAQSYETMSTTAITSKTHDSTHGTYGLDLDYTTLNKLETSTSEDAVAGLQIMEVTRGADQQLHYQADPMLPENEKVQLLGLVAANEPLVSAAMTPDKNGKVEVASLRFRIYNPVNKTDGPGSRDEGEYIPEDPYNEGKPTVYYALPGMKTLKLANLAATVKHEFTHALLGHGEKNWLTPEQAERMNNACEILQSSAVKTALARGPILESMQYMIQNSSAEFRPAYQKVLTALQNGTYSELPVNPSIKEAPACAIQTPFQASIRVAKTTGLDSGTMANEAYDNPDTPFDKLAEGWLDNIQYYSYYAYMTEERYLMSGTNEGLGHPSSNSREAGVSALLSSELGGDQFIHNIKRMPAAERGALLDMFDVSASVLQHRHPDLYQEQIQPIAAQLAALR